LVGLHQTHVIIYPLDLSRMNLIEVVLEIQRD
jgi:hypothetical protein